MNQYEREKMRINRIKETYPKGTRFELINMNDPFALVEAGTRGTVDTVDDIGTVHLHWDNGRTLGLVPGEDSFRKLSEAELEIENACNKPKIFVSDKVFSAFDYVNITANSNEWSLPTVNPIKEIENALRKFNVISQSDKINSYALSDVENVIKSGKPVVLVDCSYVDEKGLETNFHWLEANDNMLTECNSINDDVSTILGLSQQF